MLLRGTVVLAMASGASAFGPMSAPHGPRTTVESAAVSPVFGSSSEIMAAGGRRGVLAGAAAAALLAATTPGGAYASGGATAGKYTTIPIAKRRYFGRVKQGVFEFLTVGEAIKKGDLKGEPVQNFFADNIQVTSQRQKRQCSSLGGSACEVKEKFSSRWEDMKLAMFLLGNAFRMDSGKPPEKVKQVKEAKAFTSQVEKMRKAAANGQRKEAALSYAAAIEALEIFLNDVELPPTYAPDYRDSSDLSVPSLCQGSFCI